MRSCPPTRGIDAMSAVASGFRGLHASAAELKSDLLWGNLALPIDKTLEHLRDIEELRAVPQDERTDEMRLRAVHLVRGRPGGPVRDATVPATGKDG